MSPGRPELLGVAEIEVGGTPLAPEVDARVLEARVDLHLRLPDRCSLRIADPRLELTDSGSLALGATLDVSFRSPSGTAPAPLFSGVVASLEPEFTAGDATMVVRAYDRSYALNRTRRTDAYQGMSYSDIASRLARTAGLSAGAIDPSGPPVAFVQQSNETDWELLWRLADEIGFEVHVSGRQLQFRRAGAADGGSPPRLRWGEGLVMFRPRATAVQQLERVTVRGWDPSTKRPIEASAKPSQAGTAIGVGRPAAVSAFGGGTLTIADRPVRTAAQASALAASVAARIGETFVEAEGTTVGDPALRAGRKVKIDGVGTRFGGTYTLSAVTHLLRAGHGYETRFSVSGRAARTTAELVGGALPRVWRHGVVVGLVTNNKDPDGLGRVRVRYPVLGPDHEGWWARVTAPAAGARRGLLMVPQPGDEVLVAFEHGDEGHPYVVGSVWNGAAKPQELAHPDGSFALRSDRQVLVESADAMTLSADRELKLSAAGHTTLTTSERKGDGPPGNVALDAKGEASVKSGTATKVQAGSEVSVQAGTEVKVAAGTQLTIQAAGQLRIVGGNVQIQASGVLQFSGSQVMLG